MTDIEPIITKWLLSPIGLIITAIVIIIVIVSVMTSLSLMNSFPSSE